MKKLLTLILVLMLAFAVLASCGSESETNKNNTNETSSPESAANETTDNTTNPSETEGEPTNVSPFKIPEKDMRDWVVDYMYKMAEVKWTPARDMDLTLDSKGNLVGKTLTFKKGVVYHGLPYINLSTDTDYEDFISSPALTWNEEKGLYVYDCPADRSNDAALGNDCSSAILLAYRRFDNNITAFDTGHCFPLGDKTGIYPLGKMVVGENDKSTETITNNTPQADHYEALALLQKGDTVIWRTTAGHTRMVIDVHVVRNAQGKIHGSKSYITTIEQTNAMDAERKDGVNTNWYVEHTYTFEKLREKFYIPVTCKALSEERVEPEIKVESANTKKTIATAKTLLGTIESNYPIISTEIYIKDAEGNVKYTERYKPHISEISGSVSLKKFKFNFDMSTLTAGDYTYSIVVETVCGTGEVYTVNFKK